MKRTVFFLVLSGCVLWGGDHVVVSSGKSGFRDLSKRALKDIYLKKKEFIDGRKVIPVNLSAQDPLRAKFEAEVLEMDREEINNYWIEQHYQGIRPPATQKSSKSLKAFVSNVEGSVGYLPKAENDELMRILYEF